MKQNINSEFKKLYKRFPLKEFFFLLLFAMVLRCFVFEISGTSYSIIPPSIKYIFESAIAIFLIVIPMLMYHHLRQLLIRSNVSGIFLPFSVLKSERDYVQEGQQKSKTCLLFRGIISILIFGVSLFLVSWVFYFVKDIITLLGFKIYL